MQIAFGGVPGSGYCIYHFFMSNLGWNYGIIYGVCFFCDESPYPYYPVNFGRVNFHGGKREDAEKMAASWQVVDMRTLEQIKAGCCPPRLMSELLKNDATAGEPLD